MDGYVITEEFVGILWQALGIEGTDNGVVQARQHGWVEAQDLLEAKEAVKRQTAARILHEFLWRELGEKDLADISAAAVLMDLYDCHACVNHVAQVYCKGLMPAAREGVFGMRECVTREQAGAIAEKVKERFQGRVRREVKLETYRKSASDNAKQDLQKQEKETGREIWNQAKVTEQETLKQERQAEQEIWNQAEYAEQETWQQSESADAQSTNGMDSASAVAFLEDHPDIVHIDVRTAFEYANGHPQGAVNLPLMQLLEHPETVCEDRNACVLLGCDGGYRSEMAAECLKAAGYGRVYYYRFAEN